MTRSLLTCGLVPLEMRLVCKGLLWVQLPILLLGLRLLLLLQGVA